MGDPKQARGYRNRNPGNIDYVPTNRWQGQVGIEPAPRGGGRPRFAVFESHEYGIRALAMLLTTYQDRHGLRTIRQIINRWAPGTENNTGSYVGFVDARMPRHSADDVLDLHNYADMRELVVAIITHELGGNPYPDSVIDEGLRRAGLVKPVPTVAAAAKTEAGMSAMSVAAAVAAAAPAAPLLQSIAGMPQWTGVALIAAVAVVVVAVILTRRRDAPA